MIFIVDILDIEEYENEYKIIKCFTKGEHAGMCKVKMKHKKTQRMYPGFSYITEKAARKFARESPIKEHGFHKEDKIT